MSRIRQRSAKALRAARRDPALVGLTGVSWCLLIMSRGVIRALPLRRITAQLGLELQETPVDGIAESRLRRVNRIRRAIRIAAPHTPTNSNCYPQALTAHALLRLSRLPSTTYYGAALDPDGARLDTHVWVRCGPIMVSGAPEHLAFGTVSTYAYIPRGSQMVAVPANLKHPTPPRDLAQSSVSAGSIVRDPGELCARSRG